MNWRQLEDELIRDEGLRLRPYRCTGGALTIGVGRNLDVRGIRDDEARFMLHNDMAEVWTDLKRVMPWVEQLNDARQRVLVNMAFNLGTNGLVQFRKTLAAVKAGQYERAAEMMLDSLWADQVGARAQRLSRMMATGR